MRNKYKFDNLQIKEIREWKEKSTNLRLYKKIEVLDYATKGYTNREISALTGYSLSRVSDFICEYTKNGIGYFTKEQPMGGNRSGMTKAEEQAIVKKITEKALQGQAVDLHTVKEEYEKMRGRKTANATFYTFLKRIGWQRIMQELAAL